MKKDTIIDWEKIKNMHPFNKKRVIQGKELLPTKKRKDAETDTQRR